MPHVLVSIVRKSSTPNSSAAALHTLVTANRRSKADMIRLELAAVIDGGSIFRNGTYFLEGDGPLIFVAFDKVMSFFMFIENPHWGNVDAVIDGIVENQENVAQERIHLKAHAFSVTLPGFNFFRSKFDPEHGQLAPQMELLKLALLCNPVRLREITPSPEQWINLPS